VIIKDNDIPGDPFDYDLKVKTEGVHPNYQRYRYMNRTPRVKGGTGAWKGFFFLAFGALCFSGGLAVGGDDTERPVTVAVSPPSVATPSPTIVTETVAVPTVPASCMLAFERLTAMQGDLEIVIDSSTTQVTINNQAYVAIVAKKVEDITKATQAQYDLKRATSHATLQLQEQLVTLKQSLDSCKTDLGR
jgi:hypothetical protein